MQKKDKNTMIIGLSAIGLSIALGWWIRDQRDKNANKIEGISGQRYGFWAYLSDVWKRATRKGSPLDTQDVTMKQWGGVVR